MTLTLSFAAPDEPSAEVLNYRAILRSAEFQEDATVERAAFGLLRESADACDHINAGQALVALRQRRAVHLDAPVSQTIVVMGDPRAHYVSTWPNESWRAKPAVPAEYKSRPVPFAPTAPDELSPILRFAFVVVIGLTAFIAGLSI